ncbi:MAG: TetR/AcrR family transcriptional regulator [Actinomycetota bacterium]
MSPRVADPAVADALVEVGARLIAEHEPLSTRRLAAELGVSTSAVYTHFGSMDELRRAVCRVGFERLAAYQTSYEPTDDPVDDLAKQGWAYCRNALTNPNMYRVMFMEALIEDGAEIGLYTFEMLVGQVQKCIEAGRFDRGDAWEMATQLWAATHGVVALHLAGMIDAENVDRLVTRMARALFVEFGDSPDDVDASFARAGEWVMTQSAAAAST